MRKFSVIFVLDLEPQEGYTMKPALIEINDILLSTGMSQVEVDHLMARFLEEEAEDYVKTLKEVYEEVGKRNGIVLH